MIMPNFPRKKNEANCGFPHNRPPKKNGAPSQSLDVATIKQHCVIAPSERTENS